MSLKKSILCISNPTWDGNYAKSIVEITKVLSERHRILYVENAATFKDLWDAARNKNFDLIGRILGLKPRLRKVKTPKSAVWVLSPGPNIPVNFLPKGNLYRTLLRFNNRISFNQINKALRTIKMAKIDACITAFNPMMGVDLVSWIEARRHVYYCYDEIKAARYLSKHGTYLEEELFQLCDSCFVSSEGLLGKKSLITQKPIVLIKNAANIALFNSVFVENVPDKPMVGFLGSIDERLDTELVKYAVQNNPNLQFEFIGRVLNTEFKETLTHFDNVSFIPGDTLEKVVFRLKRFSVGMIPFLKNEFTAGIYPLKINEYLAAGIPVVMTDFAPLQEFKTMALSASDAEQFARNLLLQIADDNVDKRRERNAFAQQNSWDARRADIERVLFG